MPTLKRRWSADDLEDLPDDGQRYEVIDGELYVTPAPSLAHQRAIVELARLLGDYVRAAAVGDVIIAPADVPFSNARSVQPDLFVIPLVDGRHPQRFQDVGRLLLAVEVLSPSTARADRVAKRVLFRDERVPEYWIVDLDARTIERSTPADARVDVFVDRVDWWPDGAAASLSIDLPAYFARVLDD
jgi:Uma2 family endonuclease